jgi:hypothetical protein
MVLIIDFTSILNSLLNNSLQLEACSWQLVLINKLDYLNENISEK